MYKNVVVIVTIFIVILTCVVFVFHSDIPKTIYTYWHDLDNIPPIVSRCIDTWKKHNPRHKIVILNMEKVKELCDVDLSTLNIPTEFQARYADFARLFVIAKYGGIWLDSTIICTTSLEWVHDIYRQRKPEIIGYKSPQTTSSDVPVIENWFFAAPPNSPFVNDWLQEAQTTRLFPSEQEYVEHVKTKTDVDVQDIGVMLPYLIMHLCALVIQNRNKGKYNMYIMDSTYGPFKYLADNEWKTEQSVQNLCKNKELRSDIIKLRGPERIYIEENIVSCESEVIDPSISYVIKHD